jgi:hypothetical protein
MNKVSRFVSVKIKILSLNTVLISFNFVKINKLFICINWVTKTILSYFQLQYSILKEGWVTQAIERSMTPL